MKILVVGSSFASTIVLKNLIDSGFKPILIDSDNDYNISKLKLQKDDKDKILNPIQSIGGLSNYWSGSVNEYSEKDLTDWPINYEDLNPHYKKISSIVDCKIFSNHNIVKSYIQEDIPISKNIINENKYAILKFGNTLIDQKNNEFDKFDKIKPFSFRETIFYLLKNNKIDFIQGKVVKFYEKKNKIFIEYNNGKIKNQLAFDYIFLGSGAIATYKILYNSIKFEPRFVTLKTQKKLLTPILFKRFKPKKENYYFTNPLFQLNINNEMHSIYAQIYNFNINILKHLFPKIKNYEFGQLIYFCLKKFGFAYFTFGSNLCEEFYIQNEKIIINNNNNDVAKILIDNSYLYNYEFSKGLFKLLKFNFNRNALSGNHFGASFPMSNERSRYNTSINGRLHGIKRLSLIDSSIFSTLSAKPPTLTLMANSLRISTNIINKIKKSEI